MTPQPHISAQVPLVCRPSKSLWVFVFFLTIMALLLPVSCWVETRPLQSESERWFLVAATALLGFPAPAFAWYLIHSQIVADARGLTFTGLFSRRLVPWNEIEDLELRFNSGRILKITVPVPHLKIKGKWHFLPQPDFYSHVDALLQRIILEAKWSRSRTWQLGALRDDGDWLRTFVYRKASLWQSMGIPVFYTVFFLGLGIWSQKVQAFVMFAPYVLLIWLVRPTTIPSSNLLRQSIAATGEGLLYLKDGTEVFALWDDIKAYYLVSQPGKPTLGVVETASQRIEFVNLISDVKVLQNLIEVRARNASTRKWRFLHGASEDVLGGAASFWRDGDLGIGLKTHHYQTRSARSCLVLGGVIAVLLIFPIFLTRNPERTDSFADWLPVGLGLMIGVFTLAGLMAYWFSSLQIWEKGLLYKTVLSETLVRWDEIQRVDFKAYWFTLKSEKGRIRLTVFMADLEGLLDEIEERSGKICQGYRRGERGNLNG